MKTIRYAIPILALVIAGYYYGKHDAVTEKPARHSTQITVQHQETSPTTTPSTHSTNPPTRSSSRHHPTTPTADSNQPTKDLSQLPTAEQQSLSAALSKARHEIYPIPTTTTHSTPNKNSPPASAPKASRSFPQNAPTQT